jgi:dihydrofolate synthase/folylpolyglutamate synthase
MVAVKFHPHHLPHDKELGNEWDVPIFYTIICIRNGGVPFSIFRGSETHNRQAFPRPSAWRKPPASPPIPMNHQETLDYLAAKGNEVLVMHLGLHRTQAMVELLGDPHEKYPVIHIAGTNGKGSVAAMTESILRHSGLRTGLYTSPHLVRVEERIRVDGEPIAAAAFARLAGRIREAEERLQRHNVIDRPLTTFEFLTCAAFLHFARRKVEVAVMEVGLGGLLDATNVVRPVVGVVTGVALDHQDYLGRTIVKIAREKAGIIKEGVPAVSGCLDPVAQKVVRARARAVGAPLLELGRDFSVRNLKEKGGRVRFDLDTPDGVIPALAPALRGEYQSRNAALAVMALRSWRAFPARVGAIRRGLARARWEGRLDEYRAARRTLLDGVHNPEAAGLLRQYLEGRSEIHMVFGAMRDKNIREIGRVLFPAATRLYLTPLDNSRSAAPAEIAALHPRHQPRMELCSDPRRALAAAWAACPPSGLVVVTGSLYLVGELLPEVVRSARSLAASSRTRT